MKRDTLKTLAGLFIIGLIVVATFLYGNAQRQSQLRHDQDIKNQQAAQTKKAATATPVGTAAPATPANQQVATNTAPVQSPTANALQGSKATPKPTASPTPKATATPSPAPGTPLPQTGSPLIGMFGVTAIAVMALWLRRSKLDVLATARSRR